MWNFEHLKIDSKVFEMILNLFWAKILVMWHGIIHLVCTQNFPKTNVFYPLMREQRRGYQWIRNICFSENFVYALNEWSPLIFSKTFSNNHVFRLKLAFKLCLLRHLFRLVFLHSLHIYITHLYLHSWKKSFVPWLLLEQ